MRTWLLVVATMLGTCAASADEPAAGSPAAGTPSSAAQQTVQSATQGEAWRYVQKDGLWWYWLPNETWVYWVSDHWVPYEQKTYAEFTTRRQSVASTPQNSPQYYQGNWGPVRYNQFGQPQYPYSQRTSGMRQLGPVPAPGGVRALPGWGGER